MGSRDGLILWILGGAGVLFLYSAIKNKTPSSVISARLNGGQIVQISPPVGSVTNSGGGLTANPATPSITLASATGVPSVSSDITGTYNAYDANGQMLGPLPPVYQKSPGTFIVSNA